MMHGIRQAKELRFVKLYGGRVVACTEDGAARVN